MNPPRMVPWWSWRWILPVEIVTAAILIAGGIGVGIANYPIWLGKARMQGAWGESHPARIAAAEQIALHGDAGRAEAAVSVAPAAAASATGAETAAPASSAEAAASAARLSWRAALNADQPAASVFWLCGARLPVAGWQAAAPAPIDPQQMQSWPAPCRPREGL